MARLKPKLSRAQQNSQGLIGLRFSMQISDAQSGMIYGYAHVSTAAQDETGQVRQLKAAGGEKGFREKTTGTPADRPQLTKLMKALAPGDVVITPASAASFSISAPATCARR